MKKKLIIILTFVLLFFPCVNTYADSNSYDYKERLTNSFSSIEVQDGYYFSNHHDFLKTRFYSVTDNYGTYLAYSLYYEDDRQPVLNLNGQLNNINSSNLVNSSNNNLSTEQLELIKNILASGCQGELSASKFDTTADNMSKRTYLATQILIWEVVEGVRTNYNQFNSNTSTDITKLSDVQLTEKYKEILSKANTLTGLNAPSSFDTTHILHYNDGLKKYTTNNIDIGKYNVDSYDPSLSITGKDNVNNIKVTSQNKIDTPLTVNFKYVEGSTKNTAEILRWLDLQNQKLLVADFKKEAKGNFSVKTESGYINISNIDLATSNPLKGSKYEMYKCNSQSDCAKIHDINFTSLDTISDIKLEKSGRYLFKQVQTPAQYQKVNDFYIEFSINDKGIVSASVDASSRSFITTTIKDNKLTLVISNSKRIFNIKNVDGRNTSKVINGSEFQIERLDRTIVKFTKEANGIYRYDPNGTIDTLNENDKSMYSISSLQDGEYILVQKSVPKPYVLSNLEKERTTKFKIDSNDFLQVFNTSTTKYTKSSSSTIIIKNFETKVTIIKTGLKNKTLQGVKFKLYDSEKTNIIPLKADNESNSYTYDSEGTNIDLETNSDGKFMIKSLNAGTYYLEEIEVPSDSGVTIDEDNKWFEIKIFINRDSATPYDYQKEVRNAKGTFCFYKIDEDGNEINGGEFKLEKYNSKTAKYDDLSLKYDSKNDMYSLDELGDNCDSCVYLFTPKHNGQVCFQNITSPGKYRVLEVVAPDGYATSSSLDTSAQVTINDKGYAIGDALLVNKRVKLGGRAEAQAEFIINIQTGQKRMHYTLVIVIILAITAGLIIYKKKMDK